MAHAKHIEVIPIELINQKIDSLVERISEIMPNREGTAISEPTAHITGSAYALIALNLRI